MRVGELEREKVQELAAWERCRSELLVETTELQDKLIALSAIEQSSASQRIIWKAHVNALVEAVDNCRGDCDSVFSAITKKALTLLEALHQKHQKITKLKDEMAAFAKEAVEVCGQGARDIAPFLLRVEELEQKVSFRIPLFYSIAFRHKNTR